MSKSKVSLIILGITILFYLGIALAASDGNYQGQSWSIDEKHRLIWEGKPYIPYVVSSMFGVYEPEMEIILAGDKAKMEKWSKIGITEYELFVQFINHLDGPAISQEKFSEYQKFFSSLTDALMKNNLTYIVYLDPSSQILTQHYQSKLKKEDRVAFVVTHSFNVRSDNLYEIPIDFPLAPLMFGVKREELETDGLKWDGKVKVYLQDKKGILSELEGMVSEAKIIASATKTTPGKAKMEVRLSKIPEVSPGSELIFLTKMYASIMVPRASFPITLAYKENILEIHRELLEFMKPAVAKKNLRAVLLLNEIEGVTVKLDDTTYPDFSSSDDIKVYRDWLKKEFKDIQSLNDFLGKSFADFSGVPWLLPLMGDGKIPLSQENSAHVNKISELQNRFYLSLLAKGYINMVRAIKSSWGDIPVLIMSAQGDNLDIQEEVLRHPEVDGFAPHFYGSVSPGHYNMLTRSDMDNSLKILQDSEARTGRSRLYWCAEWNLSLPEEMAAYRHFRSKDQMRQYLDALAKRAVTGFFYFKATEPNDPEFGPQTKMWPEIITWYAQLKPEIIAKVLGEKPTGLTTSVVKEKEIPQTPSNRQKDILSTRYWVKVVQEIDKRQERGEDISEYSKILKSARVARELEDFDKALELLKGLAKKLGLKDADFIPKEEE